MADRKLINPAIVKDIADAIREKGGTTEQIKVADLGDAVRALPEGGGVGEDTSALLDAIGVESREDTGMANGLAIALTDAPLESSWSGERTTADGMPIKDGVAFVSALKGKTLKVNQMIKKEVIRASKVVDGLTITNNGDGSISIIGTASASSSVRLFAYYEQNVPIIISGHKYLVRGCKVSRNGINNASGSLSSVNTNYIGTPNFSGAVSFDVYYTAGVIYNDTSFPQIIDLTDAGLDSITTPDEFANLFGKKSIAELPPIPYTPTTNLQSFAPNAIVSKKDGVELGRLTFDLTTIVDADGNQLFPDGELRSASSVHDLVDYANNVAVKRIGIMMITSSQIIGLRDYDDITYVRVRKPLDSESYNSYSNKSSLLMVGFDYSKTHKGGWASSQNIGFIYQSADTLSYWLGVNKGITLQQVIENYSGREIYYELAEPIIAPIDPTKAWYPVQSNGSEEAITNTIVPMNAEIRYRVDTESLLTQSASLLRYSNEVTGANDSSLGNAVKTLTDNYK